MADKENPEIKVTDKRKFDASGERKKEPADKEKDSGDAPHIIDTSGNDSASELGDKSETTSSGSGVGQEQGSSEITFMAFVVSLATQAMVGMGLMPDPRTNKNEKNLEMARQMIDIIAMLREKTKGNLEANEITSLDNMLHDLRYNYVQVVKQSKDKE